METFTHDSHYTMHIQEYNKDQALVTTVVDLWWLQHVKRQTVLYKIFNPLRGAILLVCILLTFHVHCVM